MAGRASERDALIAPGIPGYRRHPIAAFGLALALVLPGACLGQTPPGPGDLRAAYLEQVDRRLDVPPDESLRYAGIMLDALTGATADLRTPQYLALVDRSPNVQAIFIYWLAPGAAPELIGASPVSTGRGGGVDHFRTPLGVFEHTLANPDFRAEGTFNQNGIRGYGLAGLRVFDFGWQQAERLWGRGGNSIMRLQTHAIDPDRLEPRLGTVQSKGCIRIPAALNRLLDRFGLGRSRVVVRLVCADRVSHCRTYAAWKSGDRQSINTRHCDEVLAFEWTHTTPGPVPASRTLGIG